MVPWLKPTSASADGGSFRRASSASRNCSSPGPALLTPSQRSFGARVNSGNHCSPDRRLAARLGRVRRHERGVRQAGPARPGRCRSGRCRRRHSRAGTRRGAWRLAAWRLEPRSVEFTGHSFSSIFLLGFAFGFLLFVTRRPCWLAPARPRAASPHDSRPTTDARPPRATAAIFRQASPSPWHPAASSDRRRGAPPPASARSPAGQASALPRQNKR